MDTQPSEDVRPWYKKKRFLIPLGVIAVVALASGGNASSTAPQNPPVLPTAVEQTQASASIPDTSVVKPASVQPAVVAPATAPTELSNDNYYTNVDGNQVHSPAKSSTGCAAVGASAECRDGTCSFSQHRSGTCSHHGGVAQWL